MEFEKAVGFIELGWLIGAILLMAGWIRRGRRLAAALAEKHPETYETLGRPQPGYFHSVRRSRFAQFVAHREYEKLGDPELSACFENYRKTEARLLWSLLVSLGVVALLALTANLVT